MKKSFFILVLFTKLCLAQKEKEYVSLTWMSHANFDTLSRVGQYQFFIQTCTQDGDSTLTDGEAIFNRARLKRIGQCKITRFYRDTIYIKATIEINNRNQYDSLYNYFEAMVKNQFTRSYVKQMFIYTGRFYSTEGSKLTATFLGHKRKKRAILLIE